jgi:hypothetical protein
MSPDAEQKKGWRFGVGEWIGVVGILLALITWWHGTKSRELAVSASTAVTEIVRAGVSSDISVSFKGSLISGSLRAYQIAIWNAGREPIRKEDMLKPIKLSWQSGVKVLDVKLVKLTREETGLQITRTADNLEIDLKILEQNDGGLLQFLVVGDEKFAISIEGTIVGQGRLGEGSFKSSAPLGSNPGLSRTLNWAMVVALFLMSAVCIRAVWHLYRHEKKGRARSIFLLIFGAFSAITICLMGYYTYRYGLSNSPFGF